MESQQSFVIINKYKVPTFFIKKLLENISEESMIKLIKGNEYLEYEIFKGFKVTKENLSFPIIMNRIFDLAVKDEDFLKRLLYLWKVDNSHLLKFFESLNSTAIKDLYKSLVFFIDPVDLFMAISSDKRKEVYNLAVKFLKDDINFWNKNKDEIEKAQLDSLSPLLEYFSPIIYIFNNIEELLEKKASPDEQPEESIKSDYEKEVKRKNKKLVRVQRELKDMQDRLNAKDKILERKNYEISKLTKELKISNENYKKLQSEFDKLRNEINARVKEEVENYKRTYIFTDFKKEIPEEIEKLEKKYESDDNLEKSIESAIEKQIEFNEEYKISKDIMQKIGKIDMYIDKIELIAENSPRIIDDLKALRSLLKKKREELLKLLGNTDFYFSKDEYFKNCVSLINMQDTKESAYSFLEKLRNKIEEDKKWGIVSNFIGDKIISILRKKQIKILDYISESFKVKEIKDIPVNTINDLGYVLKNERGYNYILFIDGYNVIKTVPSLKELEEKEFASARSVLKSMILKKNDIFDTIYVVFDGIEFSQQQEYNVKIIFTNKNVGVNADRFIVTEVERVKGASNRIVLITFDREIIKNTYKFLYGVVNPYNFYDFLIS